MSVADWVFAAERAYVDAAMAGGSAHIARDARARAAAGAVASRYLAVGTPRSFGLVIDDPAQLAAAALSLQAHRTWFAPRDIRCTSEELAVAVGGRAVSLDEALAADIVCVHGAVAIRAGQLRRGTHVNVFGASTIDPAIPAMLTDEANGLPALAAGFVDGRQLDEITIFTAG